MQPPQPDISCLFFNSICGVSWRVLPGAGAVVYYLLVFISIAFPKF